jgi:tetratricopeptide (TPR) repeat protein
VRRDFASGHVVPPSGGILERAVPGFRLKAVLHAFLISLSLTLVAPPSFPQQSADKEKEVTAHFDRAREFHQKGAWNDAVREYRALLEIAPDNAMARANLGVALVQLQKYDEAIREYESALRLNPQLTPVVLNLGIAHFRAGQFARAVDVLERYPDTERQSSQARQLVGMSLVELGRYKEALLFLEPLQASNSLETTALYSLGLAYLHLRRPEVSDIVKVLASKPSSAALSSLLQGQVHLERLEFEKAAAELEKAASLSQELPRQRFLLGLTYLKLGRTGQARQQFEAEIVRSPEDFLTLYYLASVLEREGDLIGARQRIEAALVIEPQSFEALKLAGSVLLKQGQAAEAARRLEQALEREQSSSEARFLLGRAYQRLGRKEEAAREFTEADRLKAQEREKEGQRKP